MYLTYFYNKNEQVDTIKLLEYMYGIREEYLPASRTPYSSNFRETRTMSVLHMDTEPYSAPAIQIAIRNLAIKCKTFMDTHDGDTKDCYEAFQIPKHSGGLRTIHAPNFQISELQHEIMQVFKYDLHVLHHNNAFAYIEGRSTKDSLIRHKNNESKWFLKLDLKNFFPSCSREFIITQLFNIYPFNKLIISELSSIIDVCLLNDGLPQGAPTSPMITNLIMLAIDYKLNKELYNFNKSHYCVTRYADDILISNKYSFKYTDVIDVVNKVLQSEDAPFNINDSKTRYASSAGRNWNLGLMYNHKGNISVGHRRKKKIKNLLYYFFRDNHEQRTWTLAECQAVIGEFAYIKQIEPNALSDHLIKLETKHNVTWPTLRKQVLTN